MRWKEVLTGASFFVSQNTVFLCNKNALQGLRTEKRRENMKVKNREKTDGTAMKLAMAGLLTAAAVAGSLISVPVAGSKCAPIQHMVNVMAAVVLGPGWGVAIAFCASLLRNMLGLGSLLAFPGSMVGALCCGLVYRFTKKLGPTCIAEALGTGVLGGLLAYPVAYFLMKLAPAGWTVYIVPFLISTVAGSAIAYMVLKLMKKSGVLQQWIGE